MKAPALSLFAVFLALPLGAARSWAGVAPVDVAQDRAALTKGVAEIVAPGADPGEMLAGGPDAFVVLTGRLGGQPAPLFVATRVGKGRAVAGGHDGFLSKANLTNAGNAQFLANAVSWLANRPIHGLRVGELGEPGVVDSLIADDAVPVEIDRKTFASDLQNVQVLVLSQNALDGDLPDQAAVLHFLKAGGGLLIAGPGWGWVEVTPGKSLIDDHTGNRLLRDYGVAFTDALMESGPFSPAGADDPALQASSALAGLRSGGFSPADTAAATESVTQTIRLRLPAAADLNQEIAKRAAQETNGRPVSPQAPITQAMPFARLQATLEAKRLAQAKPEDVGADPSAANFPGSIPDGAPRLTRTVSVDTAVPAWHPTGLYAAPGEVVAIDIPAAAAKGGLHVQIGGHTDTLWQNDKWTRFPEVSLSRPLDAPSNEVASAFGGEIYIDVPDGSHLGPIDVTIRHAVEAPLYVKGTTTHDEWLRRRDAPAPWANLEGKYVSLIVPSSVVRNLEDPEGLMNYWDEVMENCYAFFAAPKRPRPERYCTDVQISDGYMHSGYPIMTFLDVAPTFVDVAKLRGKGATWGFYHEMGHNFQQSAWTFEGTGEVTNNLFSLYGSEKMNGVTPETYGVAQPSMEPKEVRNRLVRYLADGAPFEKWKEDPFLALTMYAELREAFGWDPFTKVFAEYRDLPASQQPRTDQDKRDQWMVRFSRTIGKNLGPFFQAWGVPTTEAAQASIATLPTWMPADWPGAAR